MGNSLGSYMPVQGANVLVLALGWRNVGARDIKAPSGVARLGLETFASLGFRVSGLGYHCLLSGLHGR